MRFRVFLVMVLMWALACGDDSADDGDAGSERGDSGAVDGSVDEVDASPDGGAAPTAQQPRFEALDLLFVIDDSTPQTSDARSALSAQLPGLLAMFSTGDLDADGEADFPAPRSVHIALVSTDMGAPGTGNGVPGCQGLGGDGRFLQGSSGDPGCELDYPLFFTTDPEETDVEALAADLDCVIHSSDQSCAFEQPLEAMLKALWPASDETLSFHTDETGAGGRGHGGEANGEFLRDDSLLAVVMLTNEDDCSAREPEIFTPSFQLEPDDPLVGQPLGLRCQLNEDRLFRVSRYVQGLRELRPEAGSLLFFAIAGVPPDLAEPTAAFETDDEAAAYYAALLDDPAMEEVFDAAGSSLEPSCTVDDAPAFPPRRLVEVAKGLGRDSQVLSICEAAFDDHVHALAERVGRGLAGS